MSEYVVTVDNGVVSTSSTKRLPFEPKGWQLEQRNELRAALRSLSPEPDAMLVATYASPDDALVDIENVLLYNVGESAFGRLMTRGVVCRRVRSCDARHHMRYELGREATVEPVGPAAGRVSAAWIGAEPKSAGAWWYRLRSAEAVAEADAGGVDRFSLSVDATGPAMTGTRLANMLKSMLDGIVACFHAHDGSHGEHLRPLLASLGAEPDPWELVLNPSTAVLGTQTLIRPYGSRLAWNPADDRCDDFVVRVAAGERWTVSAELRPHTGS